MGQLATAQWIALGSMLGSGTILVLRHIFWDRSDRGDEGPEAQEQMEPA
jgi:hypothetical protein